MVENKLQDNQPWLMAYYIIPINMNFFVHILPACSNTLKILCNMDDWNFMVLVDVAPYKSYWYWLLYMHRQLLIILRKVLLVTNFSIIEFWLS